MAAPPAAIDASGYIPKLANYRPSNRRISKIANGMTMSQTKTHMGNVTPAVLTLSGLAAAFGVASCCALPLLLSTLGLGTAWIGGIGLYAAFHRPIFLAIAALGLLGGAGALIWFRGAINPAIAWLTGLCLLLGLVLLYFGYVYV